MTVHEPVPIRPRKRERLIPNQTGSTSATGRLLLTDVTKGRNMVGVRPGEIKKLLVLEQLPGPFHDSPGFDGISLWGGFTLSRILGTVPVEPDGSAYFEVPAMRSIYFVALDEKNLSVKKMQSFLTVAPGEVTGCVGCHENRTTSPANSGHPLVSAIRREPHKIEAIPGAPEIVDFARHIQPILNKHCAECHGREDPKGDICLVDKRSTPSHGLGRVGMPYVALVSQLGEIADGRNAHGNRAPRTIGSSASKLMTRFDGSHYDVKAAPDELLLVRLWLDSGAVANGTYAIMAGGTPSNPSPYYIREMKRYGILPVDFDAKKHPLDVYKIDDAYWRSFWTRNP